MLNAQLVFYRHFKDSTKMLSSQQNYSEELHCISSKVKKHKGSGNKHLSNHLRKLKVQKEETPNVQVTKPSEVVIRTETKEKVREHIIEHQSS